MMISINCALHIMEIKVLSLRTKLIKTKKKIGNFYLISEKNLFQKSIVCMKN